MWRKYRGKIIPAMAALLLTLMQLAGWQISMKYDTTVHSWRLLKGIGVMKWWQCILAGVVEWGLLSFLLEGAYTCLERRSGREYAPAPETPRYLWQVSSALLYGIYLFFLWGCYPGYFNYDMGNQLVQVLYSEVPFNAHHPLLHTIIGGGIITIGYHIKSTDLTFGVFLYCVAQMLLCAVCMGYAIRFTYECVRKKAAIVLSFLFYAFCPPVVMFAMSTTKDVSCYAILLVGVIRLYEIDRKLFRGENPTRGDWIITGVMLTLSCLLRKNIVYAIVVFAVCSLAMLRVRRRAQLVLYAAVIVSYLVVNNGMIAALHAPKSSVAEALSVPFQQMARLYLEKGESAFTGEELELLLEAADEPNLHSYDPMMADEIKTTFWLHLDTILEHKGTYISLWARKGLQYPGVYLASFLDNTYQAWYPWTVVKCFRGYRYFDGDAWQLEFGRPRLPALRDYFSASIDCPYARYPVYRMFFATGTYFWLALFTFFYEWRRRDAAGTAVLLLVLLVCGTVLMGPVSDVRYYLILFYMLPVCGGLLLRRD